MKLLALAAALALAASPALAQSARVVDGDTLKVDGVTYCLWGIDAPSRASRALMGGQPGTSRKNARQRRCEPEYTVTHASPRGSGAPSADNSRRAK